MGKIKNQNIHTTHQGVIVAFRSEVDVTEDGTVLLHGEAVQGVTKIEMKSLCKGAKTDFVRKADFFCDNLLETAIAIAGYAGDAGLSAQTAERAKRLLTLINWEQLASEERNRIDGDPNIFMHASEALTRLVRMQEINDRPANLPMKTAEGEIPAAEV